MVLAITTGLGQGEPLGLKWEDVDLDAGVIGVRRTVFNGAINSPKTARGGRSVGLTKEAIRALTNHPRESEWVFTTRVGTSISCHNLTNRSWKLLLRKAGLPDIRFHDFRHTCATLPLTKGVHPKIVQEMLGHSSITITLDLTSPSLRSEKIGSRPRRPAKDRGWRTRVRIVDGPIRAYMPPMNAE